MARYAISLFLSHAVHCRVTREVIRVDDDRAILYAQNLLHSTRISMRIVGISYDSYLVEEVSEDGETRHVGSDRGEDRDCYRAGYQASRDTAKNRKADRGKVGRFGVRSGKGKPADTKQDYLPIRRIGARKNTRQPRELSPFQQKLRAEVEAARLRAGSHGHVSRMGSNTHD